MLYLLSWLIIVVCACRFNMSFYATPSPGIVTFVPVEFTLSVHYPSTKVLPPRTVDCPLVLAKCNGRLYAYHKHIASHVLGCNLEHPSLKALWRRLKAEVAKPLELNNALTKQYCNMALQSQGGMERVP
jgi:hypothetical protein